MNAIVDRPPREATLAVAATWLAFMAGLLVGGEVEDAASFAIGCAAGAALVFVGFAAASRCRPLPRKANADRARLVLLSLAVGTAAGIANLAANSVIAAAHPAFRTLLVERFKTIEPLVALVAAPIAEEVAVRLFLMSTIAWVVSRFTASAGLVFAIALIGSAFFFALPHLDRPMPDDPTLANYYRVALLTKYTLAGLPLGWIFWRWGLPYAILCHMAANAAHLALEGSLF
jgi:membrane protease YdiL (CAAX protease family)